MTTEAELLAAVTAHPDEDAPRLALAAHWGGERERYVEGSIRRCLAARAGRSIPDGLAIRQLLSGHEREWAGPIVDHVLGWQMVRGFAEWVVVDAASFARGSAMLVRMAPLRHLDVAHADRPAAAAAFFQASALSQIVTLSFDVTGPHYAPIDGSLVTPLVECPHLGKLKYLQLTGARLTLEDQARVARATNMPALECLLFDGLEENIGTDYDGSIQSVRPNAAMTAFEERFGVFPALHYVERTHRIPVRDDF
jgi:hypothetical protein